MEATRVATVSSIETSVQLACPERFWIWVSVRQTGCRLCQNIGGRRVGRWLENGGKRLLALPRPAPCSRQHLLTFSFFATLPIVHFGCRLTLGRSDSIQAFHLLRSLSFGGLPSGALPTKIMPRRHWHNGRTGSPTTSPGCKWTWNSKHPPNSLPNSRHRFPRPQA
jgi:hypothetical protein